MPNKMKVVSLFSGAGGLDLGFHQAGFSTVWANEFDSTIWETFEHNFPKVKLDKRDIKDILGSDVPDSLGIIGGPPCQSWSEAGAGRGINDNRGKLFFEYIRILQTKQPLFFLAENVSGILLPKHKSAFQEILSALTKMNYKVGYYLLNANDFNVPQDRKRVIIVGYHDKLGKTFVPPCGIMAKKTLQDAIGDLPSPKPARYKNLANSTSSLDVHNHEYMTGDFSTIYMSRNRVRGWDEPSFTIQAGGRHAPLHPQAPKMIFIEQDKRIFAPNHEHLYRRLSVRECARIQTFPDNFTFKYNNIADGYKMVGNAVPVEFARQIAKVIYKDILEYIES
jgi:DNA (cytosine-5)-methyltransferase 1